MKESTIPAIIPIHAMLLTSMVPQHAQFSSFPINIWYSTSYCMQCNPLRVDPICSKRRGMLLKIYAWELSSMVHFSYNW